MNPGRSTRGGRRLGARALGGALLALTLGACRKPPSRGECDALLGHYVELLIASDRPGTSAAELEKLQTEARAKASTDAEFLECPKRVSRSELECALRAPSADVLEQCLL